MKNDTTKAFSFVLLATILSSFGPPIFRLVIEKMDREAGIICFLLLGGLSVLLFKFPPELRSRNKIKEIFGSKLIILPLSIGVLTLLNYWLYTAAMLIGSVTEATIVVRLAPLFVVLLSIGFLKEKVRSWVLVILATMACIVGLAIFQRIDLSGLKNLNVLFLSIGSLL